MLDSQPELDALSAQAKMDGTSLGRLLACCRSIPLAVARQRVAPRLSVGRDASDIVPQTLVEAHRASSAFQETCEPESSAWIKRFFK